MKNNINYKASADLLLRLKKFNIGDYVMLCIRSEQFPLGSVKKIHARSTWPFWILKKNNLNAYVVDLPPNFSISCTFNVEDLIPYTVFFVPPLIHSWMSLTQDLFLRAPTTSSSPKITICSRKYRFYLGWLDRLYQRWRNATLSQSEKGDLI